MATTTQSTRAPAGDHGAARSSALRARFDEARTELRGLLAHPSSSGVALARRHADVADALVHDLFVGANHGAARGSLLLGAVGGYGRRLLGLESDLDLCFVTAERSDAVVSTVEAVLYPLWDAGISVGHQIVRPSDVATDADADLAMATELLDFRPIAGNTSLIRSVYDRLALTVFSELRVASFIGQLESQAAQRHERFGDSVFLLEPDVKNGTGGLRDLDFALWAARLRFGTSDVVHLASLEVIDPARQSETEAALDFLWSVRNHLHSLARRKSDRLTFGVQPAVARALGYAHDDGRELSELQRTGEMVERFMSDYYRHARVIAHARDRILGHAKRRPVGPRPPEIEVGEALVSCEGRLGLADPARLPAEPELALRVYAEAVSREVRVLSRTRDAISVAAADPAFCARLRESPEAARLFVALCCSCRSVQFPSGSILSELHDVGLLLAMIPEFAPVVGRVHHDLYHVYTVDVHSIAAVDRLRALTRGELAMTQPLACRLAAEATRPAVLFLATLLHDVGKAIGGRDHSRRGAEMAKTILGRLGLDETEIDDACHLILHHLTMYRVAVRRDLGDPGAVAEFCRDARDRELLRGLYLLTVADLSTTSAVSMTRWKGSMLDALFRASDSYLSGTRNPVSDRVARVCAQARALWKDPATAPQFAQFLESMPSRYFLSNPAHEIVVHGALATRPRETPVGFSVLPSEHGVMSLCIVAEGEHQGAGLCVVTGDRRGLLAAITAAISANQFAIQAAQVNSRALPSGEMQAVDLFWVRGAEGPLEDQLQKLERDLTAVIGGEVAPSALFKPARRPVWSVKPTPPVVTEVLFDHHASAHHTIIEVLAEDRPALLFTLASVLHELDISIGVAKITTEGTRAIDVFYATEADGSKIAAGARTEQIRAALLAAL